MGSGPLYFLEGHMILFVLFKKLHVPIQYVIYVSVCFRILLVNKYYMYKSICTCINLYVQKANLFSIKITSFPCKIVTR